MHQTVSENMSVFYLSKSCRNQTKVPSRNLFILRKMSANSPPGKSNGKIL